MKLKTNNSPKERIIELAHKRENLTQTLSAHGENKDEKKYFQLIEQIKNLEALHDADDNGKNLTFFKKEKSLLDEINLKNI
jgi:hypothetical protein